MSGEINQLEKKIFEDTLRLHELRKAAEPIEVPDYSFRTLGGTATLRELFGEQEKLLVIHNMGQACRYCTLWGDGLDGLVPHLESAMALVMVSKDAPEVQHRFARSRGWRIRMASHGGGDYQREQAGAGKTANMPGAAHYVRRDGQLYRTAGAMFGPGDLYCSMWHFLTLAGIGADEWTPQYAYWQRPQALEDGGENLPDL